MEGEWTDPYKILIACTKILLFLVGLEKIIKINYPNMILFPNKISIQDKEISENCYTWNNISWFDNLTDIYIEIHKKICWYKIKRMEKRINNIEKFESFEIGINEKEGNIEIENNNIMIEKIFRSLVFLIENIDDEHVKYFHKKKVILIKENKDSIIFNNKITLPMDLLLINTTVMTKRNNFQIK